MKITVQTELMERLKNKVQDDLTHGAKIKGNEVNKADRIRLWNRSANNAAVFAIVATSTNRFGNAGNSIEIQRFDGTGALKLSMLFLELEDHSAMEEINLTKSDRNYWEKDDVSQQEFSVFVEQYLNSLPDTELTKARIGAEFHNPKDIEWP
jgi:vacuolar-type H+-ATPase subunit B/Vma2